MIPYTEIMPCINRELSIIVYKQAGKSQVHVFAYIYSTTCKSNTPTLLYLFMPLLSNIIPAAIIYGNPYQGKSTL